MMTAPTCSEVDLYALLVKKNRLSKIKSKYFIPWKICFFSRVVLLGLFWGVLCSSAIRFYSLFETTLILLFPTAEIGGKSILSFAPFAAIVFCQITLLIGPAILAMDIPEINGHPMAFTLLISFYVAYLVAVKTKEHFWQ